MLIARKCTAMAVLGAGLAVAAAAPASAYGYGYEPYGYGYQPVYGYGYQPYAPPSYGDDLYPNRYYYNRYGNYVHSPACQGIRFPQGRPDPTRRRVRWY